MSFFEKAWEQCKAALQVHIEVSVEEAINELIKELGISPQEIGAVPGEYHPSGTVIEGTVTHPIEDEARLLQ